METYIAMVVRALLIVALGALGGMAFWLWRNRERRDDLDPEILDRLRKRTEQRRFEQSVWDVLMRRNRR